jgi:hypothetical protein
MSNTIMSIKGEEVYVNDVGGALMIDDKTFPYSEVLPVIYHYVRGGLFGHNLSFIHESELTAIRQFIKDIKDLQEYKFIGSGNITFFPPSEENKSVMEFLTKAE